MKKNLLIIFVIFSSTVLGQLSFSGDAKYTMTVNGYQGVDPKACGNLYGLKEVFALYQDGTRASLFNGRIWSTNFSYTLDYTKTKKISSVQFHSTNRWSTFVGCNGGPNEDWGSVGLSGTCSSNFSANPVHVTQNVTVKSYPIVTIDTDPSAQYILPNDQNLIITLPDQLDISDYKWKYKIGGGNAMDIPTQYNNKAVLNMPASVLASPSDYGKIISVWVEPGCSLNGQNYMSNIVSFTTLLSAPYILSSSTTPTKCFDTTDGTATLNFDRALLAGETLKISLVDTVTGAAVLNQDITGDLQANTSYTLKNLPPGTYKLDLLGTYGGNATYTDSPTHTINFEITKPRPVLFDMASKTDVYCFQGNDGNIALSASGGQNQYQYTATKDGQAFLDWTDFSNGNNSLIQNLGAGTYKIKVRDSNQCVAKDPSNTGAEKEITIIITQPASAIALPAADTEVVQPTGYGLSNGYISVRVTGGTPNADGSYNYEWRKDTPDGPIVSAGITTDAVNNPYTIKLADIIAGKYYLTVKDRNYANAASQLPNCGIISKEFIVLQPEPLAATIEIQKQISCNIANDYLYKLDLDNNGIPDEAEDGGLKAVVTGGVGAYSYQWQTLVAGAYQDIPGATQATLSNRSAGTYKVVVHDASPTANSTDTSYTFAYPPQLAVTMSANTISCYNQNSGTVSVNATGGTGSLSYGWNTMQTTPTVTGLPGGTYFVLVTDSNGCKVQGNVQVVQPDQIVITDVLVQNPICNGASNGEIKASISGGSAPYSISWSNGATTADNTGIAAGIYTMTVTDSNGCSSIKQYTLTDPARLTVDLGADITLCLGDTQTYNVAIDDARATYQWKDQNGNIIGTSPSITLSAAGTYSVLIVDSKGCTATDSVRIKNSSEVLNPQFMLTTHAYAEASVVLVNTSPAKPQAVEWVIPANNNIQVVNKTDDYLELKFATTGAYEIGLRGIQGECAKTFYKEVVVEENTSGVSLSPSTASNINEFTIIPNPNNGVFKAIVGLGKESPIQIRIIDMVSHEVFPAVAQPSAANFVVPFNTKLPSGTYLVILETGGEAMVKRIIIQ